MTIIKLSTYYVPGPKLKALPRDGLVTTALLSGWIHLYLERRNGSRESCIAYLRPHSWEVTEAGFEYRSVEAAILLALLLPQPVLWCLAAAK